MPFRRRRFPVRLRARRRSRFGRFGRVIRKRRLPYRRRRGRRLRSTRPELKAYIAVGGPLNFNTVWGSAKPLTTLITQGVNAAQRIGRSIVVRRVTFWLDANVNALTALAVEYIRFVMWRQRSATGNAAAFSDLFDSSYNGGSVSSMAVFGTPIRGNRDYPIVYNKRWRLVAPASTSATAGQIRITRKIVIRFRKGLRNEDISAPTGASESRVPNDLWFNVLGEQGALGNYPTGTLSARIDYTDV